MVDKLTKEKNGLIVLRAIKIISKEDMGNLRESIMKQAKEGCILLPPYIEAQYVPSDIEIKFEE